MPSPVRPQDHDRAADDQQTVFHDGDGQHWDLLPQGAGGILINGASLDTQGGANYGTATQAKDCSQDKL